MDELTFNFVLGAVLRFLEGYENPNNHLRNISLKNITFVGAKEGEELYQDCVENLIFLR